MQRVDARPGPTAGGSEGFGPRFGPVEDVDVGVAFFDEVAGDVGVGLSRPDHEHGRVLRQAPFVESLPAQGIDGHTAPGNVGLGEDALGRLHGDPFGDAQLVTGEAPLAGLLHGGAHLGENLTFAEHHGLQAGADPQQMAGRFFSMHDHGVGHQVPHGRFVWREGLEQLLKPAHAEIGFVDHHEFHPVAGGEVGDALNAQGVLELFEEGGLSVLRDVQLSDPLDGGIPVVKADDMEVFRVHFRAKVVQAFEWAIPLGFIGAGPDVGHEKGGPWGAAFSKVGLG